MGRFGHHRKKKVKALSYYKIFQSSECFSPLNVLAASRVRPCVFLFVRSIKSWKSGSFPAKRKRWWISRCELPYWFDSKRWIRVELESESLLHSRLLKRLFLLGPLPSGVDSPRGFEAIYGTLALRGPTPIALLLWDFWLEGHWKAKQPSGLSIWKNSFHCLVDNYAYSRSSQW